VRKNFPADRPELAFTGSRLLLGAHRTRQAILLADVSTKPLTRRLEDPLLPEEVRSLLYPFPWQDEIRSQARRFGVDPYLLAAVIRQESQFAPDAVSAVTARGLTQFVWLTAKRLAAQLGMGRIGPADLYDPEVSILLGAAYLRELSDQFGGLEHEEVAAYNAGPAQARLWQAYCFTREMPEFYTKTGFSQTRGYLRRVLGSRAQYVELYGDEQDRRMGFRWRYRGGAGAADGDDGGGR
jgi:soluble lytic murein transglycosylase-like protein